MQRRSDVFDVDVGAYSLCSSLGKCRCLVWHRSGLRRGERAAAGKRCSRRHRVLRSALAIRRLVRGSRVRIRLYPATDQLRSVWQRLLELHGLRIRLGLQWSIRLGDRSLRPLGVARSLGVAAWCAVEPGVGAMACRWRLLRLGADGLRRIRNLRSRDLMALRPRDVPDRAQSAELLRAHERRGLSARHQAGVPLSALRRRRVGRGSERRAPSQL